MRGDRETGGAPWLIWSIFFELLENYLCSQCAIEAELAADKIRVNVVNPDGVIVGSKIWEGSWAEGRAKANGISVEELPAFYAKRNLLNEIILPEDIANGVFACVAILDKTTGNIINVDGGMANAFPR